MHNAINRNKAMSIVKRYYTKASVTGYVAHPFVKRMMAYMFLIDFIDTLYPYFEDDRTYRLVDMAMVKIFTNGGCIFQYEAKHANFPQIGNTHYMGNGILRITADNTTMREMENDFLRRVI